MVNSTRRVSVRLSLDDAARIKQELREVGESGSRSLERIQGGADRASRALNLLYVAVCGVQIAGLAAGLRAVVVAGDAPSQSMGPLRKRERNIKLWDQTSLMSVSSRSGRVSPLAVRALLSMLRRLGQEVDDERRLIQL